MEVYRTIYIESSTSVRSSTSEQCRSHDVVQDDEVIGFGHSGAVAPRSDANLSP